MTYHIVRMGETIDKIVAIYQVDLDEIKSINKYVRNWEHLIPGTKLRLPEIPESLNVELDNDEPFIEEYYPKIDINNYENFSKGNQNITQELKEKVNKEENEKNVEWFLKNCPFILKEQIQMLPGVDTWDGFFIAKLERKRND